MNTPLDWTTVSNDPNHPQARAAVCTLHSAKHVHTDRDLLGYIEALVTGKRALDIGVVEHSLRHMNRPDWRHGRICKKIHTSAGI